MEYYYMGSSGDTANQPKASVFADDAVLTGVEVDDIHNEANAENQPMNQALRDQYTDELKQVEEEIQTLKQVLSAKQVRQNFLRRRLGISVIDEFRNEVKHGIDNLRTSDAYQRTTAAVKTAKERTSSVIQEKWSMFKMSHAYKTLEDKVCSAYTSVRGKLVRQAQTVNEEATNGSRTDESGHDQSTQRQPSYDSIDVTQSGRNPIAHPGTLQMDPLSFEDADPTEPESAQSTPSANGQPQRKNKPRVGKNAP